MSDRRPWRRAAAGLGVSALLLAAMALSAAAQPPPLIEFELEDQFEAEHSDAEVRDVVAVVIAAGRKGREHTTPWGDAVRERLAEQLAGGAVAVVPVADLRGVPGFLKGRIRGRFPQEAGRWVLMDWKGRFAEAYALEEEAVSLLLFDAGGTLVTRLSAGPVNEASLAHLAALVDEALAN